MVVMWVFGGAIALGIAIFAAVLLLRSTLQPAKEPAVKSPLQEYADGAEQRQVERWKKEGKAKEERARQIRTRDRQITREAQRLYDDLRYERNRFELGETSESQARAIAAVLERKIKELTDERKRLENESYEIRNGTWQPPAEGKQKDEH